MRRSDGWLSALPVTSRRDSETTMSRAVHTEHVPCTLSDLQLLRSGSAADCCVSLYEARSVGLRRQYTTVTSV